MQNQICQSEAGLLQEVMKCSPSIQANWLLSTTKTAMPLLPVARRHIEQWQTMMSERIASMAKRIEPQLHAPVTIVFSS